MSLFCMTLLFSNSIIGQISGTVYYGAPNVLSGGIVLTDDYIGEVYGWHYGFSIAGFGMILGQLIFIKGRKNLREKAGTYKNIINKKISLIEFDRINYGVRSSNSTFQ